jgi:hypothetical protein
MVKNVFFYKEEQIIFYLSKMYTMRFYFFSVFSSTILAQTEYPKDYFSLHYPMQLSGNFEN